MKGGSQCLTFNTPHLPPPFVPRAQVFSLSTGEHLSTLEGVEGSQFDAPFAVGVASDSDLLVVDRVGMVRAALPLPPVPYRVHPSSCSLHPC